MSHPRRHRGFKACDPFCQDKVRVALYNRPNGPHQGKIILGKTYLTGIDDKCFSRTGRIKKGYRNVPIDLEREFEIEKRQIQQIRTMIRGPTNKQKKRKSQRKQQKKAEYERQKAQRLALNKAQNTDTNNSEKKPENTLEKNDEIDSVTAFLMEDQNEKSDTEMDKSDSQTKAMQPKPIQSLNELSRLENEPFDKFIWRVKQTSNYSLRANQRKYEQRKLRRKEKKLEKKLRKISEESKAKRLRKLEHRKKIKEQREFERYIAPKREYIPFGSTNDRPPIDLHKLGAELFKKKVRNPNDRNKNNLNVGGLSFASVIKERAQQMKKDEIMRNYAEMKQKRYQKLKASLKNKNKRKVW